MKRRAIRVLNWHMIFQSKLPSPDVDDAIENTVIILTAPDVKEWLQIVPVACSAERRSQKNNLREASGSIGSPASAWRLLVDNFILKHITQRTVTEANFQLQNQTFALIVEQLQAFIAVMYARGYTGKIGSPLHDIFSKRWV